MEYNDQGHVGASRKVTAGKMFTPRKIPKELSDKGVTHWNTLVSGKGEDYFGGEKDRAPLKQHVLYAQYNKTWVLKSKVNNDKIEFTQYRDGSCFVEVTIPRDKKVFKYYITDDVRKFIDNPRSPKYGTDKRTLEIFDNAKRHFNEVYKNGEIFPPISVGSVEYYALILHNMKNGELQYKVVDDYVETQYAVAKIVAILNIAFNSKKPVSSTNQGTGNACFVAGTKIATKNGLQPIEKIKVGQLVYSENPETGEKGLKKVVRIFIHDKNNLLNIYINETKIETTEEHPFWVIGKGWLLAGELKIGDKLLLYSGETKKITKLEWKDLKKPVKVYNFEVQEWHTYFVSDIRVLVHNKATSFNAVPTNPKKVSTNFLKKKGIDAHQLKRDILGRNAEIAKYNIFKDKNGELWLQQNGAKDFIPTYEYIN